MNYSLDEQLKKLGFLIYTNGTSEEEPDIEKTLLRATAEIHNSPRLASLIFSWISVHGNYIIVDKIRKLAQNNKFISDIQLRWITALAAYAFYQLGIHRWKKLLKHFKEPIYLYPKEITDSAIAMHEQIVWLKKINIIVPNNSIRIRTDDILSQKELAKIHRQYRNRYLYGASWRADIITAIENGIRKPIEIARLTGCSYEPAYRVLHEYLIAHGV